MLLAIDCGNTQTVIGLFNEHELVDHWRIATAADRTSDELALMFQQFLGFHGYSFDAQVSGGVTLDTVRSYADAGADLVSTSVITQSAAALDLAFDLHPHPQPHLRPEER